MEEEELRIRSTEGGRTFYRKGDTEIEGLKLNAKSIVSDWK